MSGDNAKVSADSYRKPVKVLNILLEIPYVLKVLLETKYIYKFLKNTRIFSDPFKYANYLKISAENSKISADSYRKPVKACKSQKYLQILEELATILDSF